MNVLQKSRGQERTLSFKNAARRKYSQCVEAFYTCGESFVGSWQNI